MSDWYGDLTGASGDQASPSPYSNTPYGAGINGGVTPSPSFPVASPGNAQTTGLGFGGTSPVASAATPAQPLSGAALGFGGTPSTGYAPGTGASALTSGLAGLIPFLASLFGGGGSNDPSGWGGSGGLPSSVAGNSPSSSDPLAGLFGGGGGSGGLFGGGGSASNPFAAVFGPQQTGSQAGALTDTFDDEGNVLSGAEKGEEVGGPWGALAGGILGNVESTFGDIQQGRWGEGAGRWIGAVLGLPLLGSFLGDTFAPAGVPKTVKSEGAVNALESSNNPVEDLLGAYIQQYGIGQGKDLAEPSGAGFNPAAYGDILQLLTGQKLPINGEGEIALGNVPGAQKPVTLYGYNTLGQIQKQQPEATELSDAQLQQIMPQLALYANRAQGGGLDALLSKSNQLATKLKNAETY